MLPLQSSNLSHEKIEFDNLQKSFFGFINNIVDSGIGRILFSPTNHQHFIPIITALSDVLSSSDDPQTKKVCATTLATIVRDFFPSTINSQSTLSNGEQQHNINTMSSFNSGLSSNSGSSSLKTRKKNLEPSRDQQLNNDIPVELKQILIRSFFEKVTPATFQALSPPGFNPIEGSHIPTLASVCQLHMYLSDRFSNEWLNFLVGVYLPSINCPQQTAIEYAQSIASSSSSHDLKQTFLTLFFNKPTKQI